MKTVKFQLKNGLQVILTESRKAPVISVQMWVRTGSADEKKKQEGISHFIEHLVFKGTRKFKVGEIASTIEGAGGELNAYTSFDQTVFHVTISKQFVDTGMLAIAEMMGFPTFDAKEIDNEREVVIEEIKRGKDSLGRAASENLFSNNYRKHPYGLPVIGYTENIRKFTSKQIEEYFHARYVPRNMFLVISGDFAIPEMKRKVDKLYGEFRDYKLKKVSRTKEPAATKPRIKVEKTAFEQSLAYVSFKVPNVKSKDVPALDVLSMILGQGESSRLVQKLRIESAIVNSVGASTYTPLDEGLMMVSIGYNKERFQDAMKEIQKILLEARTHAPSAVEIQRAILNFESEEFYSMETVDGLSRKMGSLEFYYRDLKAQEKYLNAVRKLKPVDLQKIAKKYLNPKTLALSVTTNEDVKKVQKICETWVKDFSSSVKAQDKAKTKLDKSAGKKVTHAKIKARSSGKLVVETRKVILPNGITLLLRPHQESQVISAKVALLGGLREEPIELNGATELLSRTLTCGTERRTEQQIAEEAESIAAGLSPVGGRNSVGLGLDVLAPFEKQGLDLFLDVALHARFPEEAVAREKLIQQEQIRTRADNPAQTCGRLFIQAMFSGHPYSRDMMGTAESLDKVHASDLLLQWQKHLVSRNTTFAITGNFDAKLWQQEIQSRLKDLFPGERRLQNVPTSPILQDSISFESTKKEQSHLMFGFRGISLDDPDRYTLQIIQSILAGQGGRLFLELRDKNSLAYSVSPMRMEGIETGYFGAYIGCSPEKVTKALAMMREQFEKLAEEKVPAAELERAQRYLVGRHDIDLQRTSAIGAAILYNDIYGIDFNEPFNCAGSYFAVTSEQVRELSRKIFSQKSIVALVGPQNPLG